jgi:redox-sensitive bicupin YhaK (pirin superfamily)
MSIRLIKAQRAVEGDGFEVRRPFPTHALPHLDPFLLLDHMGPATFAPGKGVGTSWHPHRGFETVTYVLEGQMEHRDSMGNHGLLDPGDTQWMTAAAGVLHKEGPSAAMQRTGGTLHGLQLWVNLPAAEKMGDPAYQDLRDEANARREEPGAVIRVIAGSLFGLHGPGRTRWPISYAHVTLEAGATVTTDLPDGHRVLVYPMTGAVDLDGTEVAEGVLAVVDGAVLRLTGTAASSEVIVLTGEPIGEPVARYGPFVMNTDDELRQAFRDFDAGRFGTPTD